LGGTNVEGLKQKEGKKLQKQPTCGEFTKCLKGNREKTVKKVSKKRGKTSDGGTLWCLRGGKGGAMFQQTVFANVC